MRWEKRGQVFSSSIDGQVLLAQCPTAIDLGNVIRVYYGARSGKGAGQVCFIDVDRENPTKIVNVQSEPVLTGGKPGAFDQDGVLPVAIKPFGNGELALYYGGFSRMVTIPHTCMMGLAISKDGGNTFQRLSKGPVLPISKTDPYLIGSADVIFHNGLWHMIYTSGTEWFHLNNKFEQSYLLKYAQSSNGIDWQPTGKVVFERESEFDAYAKPSIFAVGDEFFMYFSKRRVDSYRDGAEGSYSFGFATSKDMINWSRDDSSRGIEASSSGWDSEMICYPSIVKVGSRVLMFYNGNGFGKTGFGLAELASV
jgi:predicted GH43/DUF377 family glycosyl hydrolase